MSGSLNAGGDPIVMPPNKALHWPPETHLSHFVQCYDFGLARSAPDAGASELNR